MTVLLERFDQASSAKFFAARIEGLGNTIRVERQQVSPGKLPLFNRATPLREKAKNRARGNELFPGALPAKQDSRIVSAVSIAKTAGVIFVLPEKERGVRAVGGVFTK